MFLVDLVLAGGVPVHLLSCLLVVPLVDCELSLSFETDKSILCCAPLCSFAGVVNSDSLTAGVFGRFFLEI